MTGGLLLLLAILLFALGVGVGVLLLEIISLLGRPKTRDNPYKLETYECGELPIGGRKVPVSFQYYRFAIAFTAIDVFSMFFILMGFVLSSLALEVVGLFVLLVLVLVYYAFRMSS